MRLLASLLLIITVFSSIAIASDNSAADSLYRQASELIQKAKKAEKSSYKIAYEYYTEGMELIDSILETFPDSKVAKDLKSGKKIINEMTLEKLQSLNPGFAVLSRAEENPLYYPIGEYLILWGDDYMDVFLEDLAFEYATVDAKEKIDDVIEIFRYSVTDSKQGIEMIFNSLDNDSVPLAYIAVLACKWFDAYTISQILDTIKSKNRPNDFKYYSDIAINITEYKSDSLCDYRGYLTFFNYDNANYEAFQKSMEIYIECLTLLDSVTEKTFGLLAVVDFYKEHELKKEALKVLDIALNEALALKDGDRFYTSLRLEDIARKYLEFGMEDKAEEVMLKATAITHKIEAPDNRSFVYRAFADYYLEFGKREKALEAASYAVDAIIKSDIYSKRYPEFKWYDLADIVEFYAEMNECVLANNVALLIKYDKSRSEAFMDLAVCYYNNEEMARYYEIVDCTYSTIDRLDDIKMRVSNYRTAGEVLLAGGCVTEAKEFLLKSFNTIQNSDGKIHFGEKPNIANALARSGDYDLVSRVLKSIIVEGWKRSAPIGTAEHFAKKGFHSLAIKVINEYAPNIDSSFAKFSRTYKIPDQLEYALNVVELIEDTEIKSKAQASIAIKCIYKDDLSDALSIVGSIESPRHKANVLNEIIKKRIGSEDKKEAINLLSKTRNTAMKIKNYGSKAFALQNLALHSIELNQTEYLNDILSVAFEAAKKIEDDDERFTKIEHIYNNRYANGKDNFRPTMLEQIAKRYAQIGMIENALAVVEAIKDRQSKTSALRQVIMQYYGATGSIPDQIIIEKINKTYHKYYPSVFDEDEDKYKPQFKKILIL